MTIQDIIQDFKNHQLQYGLGGDPELEELYKWKMVTEQIGHPDVNAVDFAKEVNSLSLKNLCYSTQTQQYDISQNMSQKNTEKPLLVYLTKTSVCRNELTSSYLIVENCGMAR